MFELPHHQRIAQVLTVLDSKLLRAHQCWFGGGTALALQYGEYRQSVDIDFLVSNLEGYRTLRQITRGTTGVLALMDPHQPLVRQARDVRADQYGIRTVLKVDSVQIKFEIVLEGRIELAIPEHEAVCGVATLTRVDSIASKLLANSDRWTDDGVFARDIIDLAFIQPSDHDLRSAAQKAKSAYGPSVLTDATKAIDRLETRRGWLGKCHDKLQVSPPKAVLWNHLRTLRATLNGLTP